MPTEDPPADDNTWCLGKATPALKILGNLTHT